MAMFHGKTGNIYWDESQLNISHGQSWTCEAVVDVAETTSFQDSWKSYLSGVKDWTATIECKADDSGPQIPFTTAGGVSGLGEDNATLMADNQNTLELFLVWDTSGNTQYVCLYGQAVVTGIAHTVGVDDVETLTYSFQGTGTLAFFDSTTTSHPFVAD